MKSGPDLSRSINQHGGEDYYLKCDAA